MFPQVVGGGNPNSGGYDNLETGQFQLIPSAYILNNDDISSAGPLYMPPGVDIEANIEIARKMSPTEFYDAVKNKGIWDFKQQDSKYANFGNFHFGIVGRAAGFPKTVLERMAGWTQARAGTSLSKWGSPLGRRPYGDDPVDNFYIRSGIDYYDRFYK